MVQYSLVIKEITDLHVDDDIANFATFVDWIYWIYFVWFDNGDIIIVFSEFFFIHRLVLCLLHISFSKRRNAMFSYTGPVYFKKSK